MRHKAGLWLEALATQTSTVVLLAKRQTGATTAASLTAQQARFKMLAFAADGQSWLGFQSCGAVERSGRRTPASKERRKESTNESTGIWTS